MGGDFKRIVMLYYDQADVHPKTRQRVRNVLNLIISHEKIDEAIKAISTLPKSQKMIAKRLLKLGFQHQLFDMDYSQFIRITPDSGHVPVWLNPSQHTLLEALISVAPMKFRSVFALARYMGLRHGEIVGLRDIPDGSQVVPITGKGNKTRLVPVAPQVIEILPEIVFPVAEARVRSAVRHLQCACRCAGLPVLRLHDLRAIFLTTLATRGVRLDLVQMVAGHSNIHTTSRYYLAKDISEICSAVNGTVSGRPVIGSNA